MQQYAVPLNTVSRLPFRYLKHTSKLIRKLGNSDLALHHNKVIHLKLADASMDASSSVLANIFHFAASWADPPANVVVSEVWSCHLVTRAAAGRVFREHGVWREVRNKGGQESQVLTSERLYMNRVGVKYGVEESLLR
jgi:hypothetical protein